MTEVDHAAEVAVIGLAECAIYVLDLFDLSIDPTRYLADD